MNNFGRILIADCVNVEPPPDQRCNDPAFALSNPDICFSAPFLLIKPSVALTCALGSIQFKAFYVKSGVETDVTAQSIFVSSNTDVAVVGAISGNATGLSLGQTTIVATYQGLTAQTELNVLGGSCCADQSVAMMLMVDTSKSMSQAFGGTYPTRLNYAKAAVTRFINEVNQIKDIVGLMRFNATDDVVLAAPTSDKASVAALVPGIAQTQQLTTFYNGLSTAIDTLNATASNLKVLVLLSDGEDNTTSYLNNPNPIALLSDFKAQGGIVICLGCRASGKGFNLLSAFATGGFFINGYPATAQAGLDYLSGLKGYICAGNCTPAGDVMVATGQLNYAAFKNWDVVGGTVDLQGNGFFDLLPGNGLYVDLAGTAPSQKGRLRSKTPFALTSGHNYRVSVCLAGNQRVDAQPESVRVQLFYKSSQLADPDDVAALHAPITVVAGNVIPAETYQYKISFTDVNGETLLDTQFGGCPATIVNDGDTIQVSCTPLPPVGTTSIRLWRTTGEVPTSRYYLIGTINLATFQFNDIAMTKAVMLARIASGQINALILPPAANTTGITTYLLDQLITVNDFTQDFKTYSFSVAAPAALNAFISVQQQDQPVGGDPTIGLLLGCVRFDDTTNLTSLLNDNFDGENIVYVPPACGVGTIYGFQPGLGGYGYAVGYNCYGQGCLSSPPGTQMSDPNPLSDIELGFTPPKQYNSTKTACAFCPVGTINLNKVNLVPTMTSATAPSGIASSSSELPATAAWKAFDHITSPTVSHDGWSTAGLADGAACWLQYKFAAAQVVSSYAITADYAANAPVAWTLQGSQNGSTWTDLDSHSGINWFYQEKKSFTFVNTVAFLYYRLLTNVVTHQIGIDELELFTSDPSAPACADGTGSSTVSQAAADQAATLDAQAKAQALLNCHTNYVSTQQYTAKCAVGQFGQDVTKSATASSLNNQQEADAAALAAATLAANNALVCTLSNNTQKIVINDTSGGAPAPATPYPSVQYVSGVVGLITKVQVKLHGLSHTSPADILMLLRGPDGTTCILMAQCGNGHGINNLEIVFDDTGPAMTAAQIVAGTYKPTTIGAYAPLPAPAPQPAYGTTLAVFNGKTPNGSWSLWIGDDTPLDSGSVNLGWEITITAV